MLEYSLIGETTMFDKGIHKRIKIVLLIVIIVFIIITYGMIKGRKVYEWFVEGAKEGLKVCANIFPYLLLSEVYIIYIAFKKKNTFIKFL